MKVDVLDTDSEKLKELKLQLAIERERTLRKRTVAVKKKKVDFLDYLEEKWEEWTGDKSNPQKLKDFIFNHCAERRQIKLLNYTWIENYVNYFLWKDGSLKSKQELYYRFNK